MELADNISVGTRIAGRYRVLSRLGKGGFSTVYRVVDAVDDQIVALKLSQATNHEREVRLRREIAALYNLRLPGVVPLLDDGTWNECRYLVMPVLGGERFPGREIPCQWSDIRDTVASLLDTLAAVHEAGIVHRDLKPGNVLVDSAGNPTLLDFGLARTAGHSGDGAFDRFLGNTVTMDGSILGTPAYLAPEQVLGKRATVRTDLYSLGVMIYEALSGTLPHRAENARDLIHKKIAGRPIPLGRLAPDAPTTVCDVIDQVLSSDADDRPSTADELLNLLVSGPGRRRTSTRFRWLGSKVNIQSIERRLQARQRTRIWGAPGSGRTRLLEEVSVLTGAKGLRSLWSLPSAAPFSSLRRAVGDPVEWAQGSLDEVAVQASQRCKDALEDAVLFIDDPLALDPWSVELLDTIGDQLPIVEIVSVPEAADLQIRALGVDDIRGGLAGRDRLFHACEDVARLVYNETGGRAGRVGRLLGRWVARGLCRREGERVHVDRSIADRLESAAQSPAIAPVITIPEAPPSDPMVTTAVSAERLPGPDRELLDWLRLAWPYTTVDFLAKARNDQHWILEARLKRLAALGFIVESGKARYACVVQSDQDSGQSEAWRLRAHQDIARVLPPGRPGRLNHLLMAHDLEGVIDEALFLAQHLTGLGRFGRAVEALKQGLEAAAEADSAEYEHRVLLQWSKTALAAGTVALLREVRYVLTEHTHDHPDLIDIADLVLLSERSRTHESAEILSDARGLPGFSDPELDHQRAAVIARAAHGADLETERLIIDQLERWAASRDDSVARASYAGWLARLRYREGEYAAAASLHLDEATGIEDSPKRVGALVNAAAAAMEAFDLKRARAAAMEAWDLSQSLRFSYGEGYAEWVLRTIAYRLSEPIEPDGELVAAIGDLGTPDLEALVLLTEAAIARQCGQYDDSATWSLRAYRIWKRMGKRGTAAVAGALYLAVSQGFDNVTPAELLQEASRTEVPDFRWQIRALLQLAGSHTPELPLGPLPAADIRRDVLSPNEYRAIYRGL